MLVATVFALFRPSDYVPLKSTPKSTLLSDIYNLEDPDARFNFVNELPARFLCDKPPLQVYSNFQILSTNLRKLESRTLLLLIQKGKECLTTMIVRDLVMNSVIDPYHNANNYYSKNYQYKYLYTSDEVNELLPLIEDKMDMETSMIISMGL